MPEYVYDATKRCPIFEGYVKDLDSFMRCLQSICGYEDYKNDSNFIIFNSKVIPKSSYPLSDLSLFDGFIIDEICIIENEYISEKEIYKIRIIPYIFLDSVTTNEIIDLYKRLFDRSITYKDNNPLFSDIYDKEIIVNFQNLYDHIQYLIGYFIGSYLIEMLKKYCGYNFEYPRNYEKICGMAEEYYIKEICWNHTLTYDYGTGYREKIYENMEGYKHRSRVKEDGWRGILIDALEWEIYKRVHNNPVSLPPVLSEYLESNERRKLYRVYTILFDEKSKYIEMIPAMINGGNVIWIEQTIIKGPLYGLKTPFDERIFFCGIYELYEKSGRNYEVFMKNYKLFINKFHTILDLNNFFTTTLISRTTFSFLEDFFRNIKKEEFSDIIEYRKQLLKDEETKVEQKVVRNKISFILTSDDFEWA